MKKVLLLGLGAAIAAGAAVYFVYVAPRVQRKAHQEEHRRNLERELEPLTAMLKAPDGATPCETVFIAFSAFDEKARAGGIARPWVELPDRASFLQRCATLSQQEQLCMQPRYQARAHELCDPLVAQVKARNVLYQEIAQPASLRVSEPR